MEDERILKLYLDRNEQAITETARKYGPLCRSIALRLLGSFQDAEECVNDTYHTAWNRIPPDFPQCLAAYLGRITRNISVSRFRENTAAKRGNGLTSLLSELEDCIPSSLSVENRLEQEELSENINSWLDSLDEEDAMLFVRRYWYGDGLRELAKKAHIPAATLSRRLGRLRNDLKSTLEQQGVII